VEARPCGTELVRLDANIHPSTHPPFSYCLNPQKEKEKSESTVPFSPPTTTLFFFFLFLLTTVNLRDLQSSFESSVVCRKSTQKRAGKLMARSSQTGKRQEKERERHNRSRVERKWTACVHLDINYTHLHSLRRLIISSTRVYLTHHHYTSKKPLRIIPPPSRVCV
jgi:hypothetical protein